MNDIKAIFFDLGNVLVRFDINRFDRYISDHAGVTAKNVADYLADSKVGKLYMEGRISTSRFYSNVKRRFRMDIKFRDFYKAWNSIFFPYPEMENLVKKIREKNPGLILVIISDTNEEHFNFLQKEYTFINDMDHFVLSHEVGKLKPHPRMYNRAMKLTGTDAKNVVYFDDREDLIKAARTMGIRAFLFTGHVEFVRQLNKCGLTI